MNTAESQFEQYNELLISRNVQDCIKLALSECKSQNSNPIWYGFLGVAYHCGGQYFRAAKAYRRCISRLPLEGSTHLNFSSVLSTCPIFLVRRGALSVRHAEIGLSLVGTDNWRAIAIYAASNAQVCEWSSAVELIRTAISKAPAKMVPHLECRLLQYRERRKCRISGDELLDTLIMAGLA